MAKAKKSKPKKESKSNLAAQNAKDIPITKTDIPVSNQITAFMHCKECLENLPVGTSPREYASLECGWTPLGFQVWCKRHEANVVHVDFEGHQLPANSGRAQQAEFKTN